MEWRTFLRAIGRFVGCDGVRVAGRGAVVLD